MQLKVGTRLINIIRIKRIMFYEYIMYIMLILYVGIYDTYMLISNNSLVYLIDF